MTCARCGGYAENIGSPDLPILVHRELGGCWRGGLHRYAPRGRQPRVEAVDRAFKVAVATPTGAIALYWPWEVP